MSSLNDRTKGDAIEEQRTGRMINEKNYIPEAFQINHVDRKE